MSGSTEWNAHLNGKTEQYNFSYRPAMTTPNDVNTPPQMQQSTNKLVLPASNNKAMSANKAVTTVNKTVSAARANQNGSKKNQLPPPPSAMIVRGGKRKSKRKGRTHKKKRQY